ncbi:MAG: response regulator transcription factor [Bacteroidetes bacterium]|nr:response regulator transcription factor [Bacteroidota bacterium]MBK9672106.1 response regulator transcription factor [Bacteroidota bacterium]MBK9800622.1 response regulator transcription factor [Bacteroidota bacterium]MBP6411985.1 response regulator transcription factor [Bacteroidia bacterium]
MEKDKAKIKLVLVDDHQMLLDGLAALLQGEQRFDLVGLCNNAKYALELIESTAPDIVITDINMPEISGVELTRMIRKYYPKIKVLALSMFGERSTISEMLEAGISGYILKNTGKEELINALVKVHEGGMYFSDEITEELIKSISQKTEIKEEIQVRLTERELEIVKLIAAEKSNLEIATQLFISERTVETHRKNIFRKTNTKGVVGLLKLAMEQKWI